MPKTRLTMVTNRSEPFKPEPCLYSDPKEISIKDFVESGALDEVNRVLSARGLELGFHKIGEVYSNAVFIKDSHSTL